MIPIEEVLKWALAQNGDTYVFGAEVSANADDAAEWDCSELVEWSCRKAGVEPTMPDGAFNQWKAAEKAGSMMSVADGMNTRGALLFVGDGTGSGRDAITHVAISLGDGSTFEARGRKWGVGSWPAANRFDFAARIPGVDYGPGAGFSTTTTESRPSVPPFPGTVKRGVNGDATRQVQQRLAERGWTIEVDGEFGPATAAIVRAFQAEKGLDADGVVGPRTWDALWRSPVT